MDIFKLGDKILALLEAVFGFWNNQISLVFAMESLLYWRACLHMFRMTLSC